MSSLATTYRPRKFEQLHGQEQTTQVLAAMVDRWRFHNRTLPSGVLLTGPRGGGKTTSARILAALVNCVSESTDDMPCGTCMFCTSIFAMTSDAVLELDGATSGSAEVIRDLASKARMTHSARFRVIIIDECHAMSSAGFSALLKQLEEPPPAVMYVLVTTDTHAVPETIASRCLVFPFRLIAESDIVRRLTEVCDAEGFSQLQGFDSGVLDIIASRANGALRDALMLLEHLSVTSDFSVARANTLWPDNSREFAGDFVRTALAGDPTAGINVINTAFGVTRDSRVLMAAVSRHLRERALEAHQQGATQALRTFSEVIRLLWDFTIGTRAASPSDPTPLEGLWFTMTAMLAKARPAGSAAGSTGGSLLEKQRAAAALAKAPGQASPVDQPAAPAMAPAAVAAVLGKAAAPTAPAAAPKDDTDDILASLTAD